MLIEYLIYYGYYSDYGDYYMYYFLYGYSPMTSARFGKSLYAKMWKTTVVSRYRKVRSWNSPEDNAALTDWFGMLGRTPSLDPSSYIKVCNNLVFLGGIVHNNPKLLYQA